MTLSPGQKARSHVNAGVVVTQVREGGVFADNDIPRGAIITSINKQPVNSITDIDTSIKKLVDGKLVISGQMPDGSLFTDKFDVD